MKTLAYCIVSHNRPHMLEMHLSAICSTLHASVNDKVSVYIFDNSTGEICGSIQALASRFSVKLMQTEGSSLASNFGKVLQIERHRFCMITHDDDACFIFNLSELLSALEASDSSKAIYASQSLYIDDSTLRIRRNSDIPLLPFHRSIYPWKIPAFPAWIYPMSSSFRDNFDNYLLSFPVGKYSDVLFLDKFLSQSMLSTGFSIAHAPGILYLYRMHSAQDSASFRLIEYLNMLVRIDGLFRSYWLFFLADVLKKILYTCLLRPMLKMFSVSVRIFLRS